MISDRYLLTPFFLDQPLPELESLVDAGWIVNRPTLPEAPVLERMSIVHRGLAQLVADAVGRGERPVSIAGDCCATLPVMAGLRRAGLPPVLVWLDAHGDFNTPETTPSGFLGGMPLAMLVGRGDPTLMQAVELRPFPEERVVLTDARDLDPGERALVEESRVLHLSDPRDLFTRPLPEGPLYVHLDPDIVDPEDAPAMSYPAADGIRAAELRNLLRRLAASHRIAAVSLSAWNPELEGAERTREVCLELLEALTGGPDPGRPNPGRPDPGRPDPGRPDPGRPAPG